MHTHRETVVNPATNVTVTRAPRRRRALTRRQRILRAFLIVLHNVHVKAYRGTLCITAYMMLIFGLLGVCAFTYFFFLKAVSLLAGFILAL